MQVLTIWVRYRGDADRRTRARLEVARDLRERVGRVGRPGPESAEVGRREMCRVDGPGEVGDVGGPVLGGCCFGVGFVSALHCVHFKLGRLPILWMIFVWLEGNTGFRFERKKK